MYIYICIQDNPDQGVLYLIRGLLNVIADFSFDKSSDAKVAIYMNIIVVLSAMSQERYAYSIDKGRVQYRQGVYSIDKGTA